MGCRVCVSLMAESVRELLGKVERAREEGADIVELRLDYLREEVVNVNELVSSFGGPVILTVRRREEGGAFPLGEGERIRLIERCIKAEPDIVDLELSMGAGSLQRLISLCRERGVSVILSYHDFNGTPSWRALRGKVSAMFRLGCDVAKVVTTACSVSDNLQLLGLASLHPQRVVSFCMGKLGVLSRVLCTFFGSPFTYASLDVPLAPGQIDVRTMKKVQEKLTCIFDLEGNLGYVKEKFG
ncbi:MAG: type I 3-dehydroquinate dehydratase [Candidatus Freyarchaeota archaeon]|nr:type I 3-dehydroquinate dehydratase [Candidatus Jordarchaeia archaeon]